MKKIKINDTRQVYMYVRNGSNTNGSNINYSIGWNKERIIDSSYTQKVTDGISKIKNFQYKIQPKDVIYTGKLSNIPRFKLKEYMGEHNLKRTSRIEQSTCILISRKRFDELTKDIKLMDVLLIPEESLLKDKIIKLLQYNSQYLNDIKKDLFYINLNDKNFKSSSTIDPKTYNEFMKITPTKNLIFKRDKTGLMDSIMDIIELLDKDIKIIFDEDIFIDLNKNGIELDKDYEKILRQMIFNNDRGNVKLAFEMISNLILDDLTILRLALLMNEYYNHDNFSKTEFNELLMENNNLKTLNNLFKSKKIYWDQDWLKLASGLRMNYKSGEEANITKQFIINNINRLLSSVADTNIIDIEFGE